MAVETSGSADLHFGEAVPAEVQQVVDLVQSAYRGDASRAGWTTEADLIEGQRVDASMVREVTDDPAAMVLTARLAGELVACCELRQRPEGGDVHLGMFAVRPAAQAGGLGRAVLAEAERIARSRWQARRIVMTVLDVRTELIGWYERRGYSHTGESGDFPYGDDRFGTPVGPGLRFTVMAKVIAPDTGG